MLDPAGGESASNAREREDMEGKRKARVALFEADGDVRRLIAGYLRERGYEVYAFSSLGLCEVSDGGTCPRLPGERCADIILSDVDERSIDGLAFVEGQLKKGCKAKAAALMSAVWPPGYLSRAAELGVRVFSKPFDLDALTEWIEFESRFIDESSRLVEPRDNWPGEAEEEARGR